MKWYKYIYKVKKNSTFRFNEEGDLLKEVTIIANSKRNAFSILERNYPHFKKDEVVLANHYELTNLFK